MLLRIDVNSRPLLRYRLTSYRQQALRKHFHLEVEAVDDEGDEDDAAIGTYMDYLRIPAVFSLSISLLFTLKHTRP